MILPPYFPHVSIRLLRLLSPLERDISALRLIGIFKRVQTVAGVVVSGHGVTTRIRIRVQVQVRVRVWALVWEEV